MADWQQIGHAGNVDGMVVCPAFFPVTGASGELSGAATAVGEKVFGRGALVP